MKKNVLAIDFGSTYTKVVAIDLENEEIIGRAESGTTVESDIMLGLNEALEKLYQITGESEYKYKLACSSAAGGLRMIAVGFVKELTSEAANRAALGAGAKVIDVFSYGLDDQELKRVVEVNPDLVLLAGGTDGGNASILIHNAEKLAQSPLRTPIILAGNSKATAQASDILRGSGKEVIITENVMPEFNKLNVGPARNAIKETFMSRIVLAKGLDKARSFVDKILMPTPMAILNAAELIAKGSEGEEGMGELLVVDVGGATTDIHSITKGNPTGNAVLKGLPEPYAKRTVEGDLGIRYNSLHIFDRAGENRILEKATLQPDLKNDLKSYLKRTSREINTLPKNDLEAKFDLGLARAAVEISIGRHAGTIEEFYLPDGRINIQVGKDLTNVKTVIGTGGIFAHSPYGYEILKGVAYDPNEPFSLRPKTPKFYLDRSYIVFAIGLLSDTFPCPSLRIAKRYFEEVPYSNYRNKENKNNRFVAHMS